MPVCVCVCLTSTQCFYNYIYMFVIDVSVMAIFMLHMTTSMLKEHIFPPTLIMILRAI